MRANHNTPRAMTAGPTVMNSLGPYRAANFPNLVENATRNSVPGIPISPAAAGL